jgi:hypothetical protein
MTLCALPLPASANIVFTGSGNSENGHAVSGEAEFSLSGSILTLLLTNTSGDTAAQGDTLTGLLFSINGNQTLAFDMTGPSCDIALPGGSLVWTSGTSSSASSALCGSWTNVLADAPPIATEFGVAATGFNGEFNGDSIGLGNASPNYGIVGGSTFPGSIGGSQFPFVQNRMQFAFHVTAGAFPVTAVTQVNFLFGTDGSGNVAGQCTRGCTLEVPEPPMPALLAAGAAMLAFALRRRRSHRRQTRGSPLPFTAARRASTSPFTVR